MTSLTTRRLEGRERVLQEARTLFIEQGFADVSMQQIADASGMTKAALYYHFRSKEDLFLSVAMNEFGIYLAEFSDAVNPSLPLRENLERIAWFAFNEDRVAMGRLHQDLEQHIAPERLAMMGEGKQQFFDMGLAIFQQAIDRGEINAETADAAMKIFLGMVIGQTMLDDMDCSIEVEREVLVPLLIEAYLNGLAPRR